LRTAPAPKLAALGELRAPTTVQLPDSDHFWAAFAAATDC